MNPIKEAIEKRWGELRRYPNVLNVNLSKKFVKGQMTGTDCITVFVSKKLSEAELKTEEILPKVLDGIPVDVVELSTKDYVMGETSASRRSPEVQRRLGGGVRK